jgi:hypothetical protein
MIQLGILLALVITGSGCASWLPREEAPFYVGAEGLRVYAEASGSAQVIGRLALHERVMRSEVERGYAHIRSQRSGIEGWVDNAKLLARLPAAGARGGSPAAPVGEPAARAPEEPAAETPKDEPPAAEPASAESTPATPPPPDPPRREPAVFDPF